MPRGLGPVRALLLDRVVRWTLATVQLVACVGAPLDELVPAPLEPEAASPKVELKVTLPPDQTDRAREVLELRPEEAERRAIWFFDSPSLTLLEAGIVLRVRTVEDDEDDSTVKIRPLAATEVDPSWRGLDGFKCEIDRLPDRAVSSCSLTAPRPEGLMDAIFRGSARAGALFTFEQQSFLAPYWPEDEDEIWLLGLGPTDARVWGLESQELDRKIKVELWTLADGHVVLEVSTKVDASEADAAEADLVDYLARRGLTVADTQETKTRAAMEAQLAALAAD